MKPYRELCEKILRDGVKRVDRTGIGTLSIFGHQMRFDLSAGFPLLTLKRTHWKSIVHELLWFISGSTNVEYLRKNGVTIWDEWADENGELGPVYGKQWRAWGTTAGDSIDQLTTLISQIKSNPESRRLIISAWNVAEIHKMALPPCHSFMQFYVTKGKLSCQLYQRSGDVFLGVPFNIASYALLTHLIAGVCGLGVGEFIHTIGDSHLYLNHVDLAKEMLSRSELPLPALVVQPKQYIDDYNFDAIQLIGYVSHPSIKAKVAV